jgi:uncharacterized membrane protein
MSNPQSDNPYASPRKFDELPAPGGAKPIGAALPWRPTEALRFGWDAVLLQPLAVLVVLVANLVASAFSFFGQLAQFLLNQEGKVELGWMAYGAGLLLGLPLSIWMNMGLTRYMLKLARGQQANFGEIFLGGPFIACLLTSILLALGVGLGMLLLLVPGIVLAIGWSYWMYLLVDRGQGPVEALGTSWKITRGFKWKIFGMMLLFILVTILGVLACGVGVLVAMPVCQLAMSYVFMKLTGEEPVLPPKFS